jgi:hypothetical protein
MAQAKKGAKPPAKNANYPEEVQVDMSEEPSVQFIDIIQEPEHELQD